MLKYSNMLAISIMLNVLMASGRFVRAKNLCRPIVSVGFSRIHPRNCRKRQADVESAIFNTIKKKRLKSKRNKKRIFQSDADVESIVLLR